jgi:decaprenylphospho-beta-D-ribofuranose 2-oxidase
VLKRFGQENSAPLSFPFPGFTLALDIPIHSDKLFTCLDILDEIVICAGGRVYLAKDARLKPEAFRAMYPRYPEWLAVKQQWDPENRFSSSLSRRLEIG